MKTFQVVYTIRGQEGRKVTFVNTTCKDFAYSQVEKEMGGWGKVVIWSVTEVK